MMACHDRGDLCTDDLVEGRIQALHSKYRVSESFNAIFYPQEGLGSLATRQTES